MQERKHAKEQKAVEKTTLDNSTEEQFKKIQQKDNFIQCRVNEFKLLIPEAEC